MKRSLKANLIAVIAFSAGLPSSAQPAGEATEIRVRIMDSRTHRPLKGRNVQITCSGMDGQWYHSALIITGKTRSDGVVVFEVKQPLPPRIDIIDLDGYPCSRPEDFPTQEILKNGVVAARWLPTGFQKVDRWCTADPQAADPQQRPGEAVFFVHPLNVWQNFWYTLLK